MRSSPARMPHTQPSFTMSSSTRISLTNKAPAFSAWSASHRSNVDRKTEYEACTGSPSFSLEKSRVVALSSVMKDKRSFVILLSTGAEIDIRIVSRLWPYKRPPVMFFAPLNGPLSTTTTSTPAFANTYAAVHPARPPPTIMTSNDSSPICHDSLALSSTTLHADPFTAPALENEGPP